MKTLHKSIFAASIVSFFAVATSTVNAQSVSSKSFDDKLNHKIETGSVQGAEKGSLICQDENGNKIVCSGSELELILGFATNAPYITINKPENPNDRSNQFTAIAGSQILKGDFLIAGKNGSVISTLNNSMAYAIAIEDAVLGQKLKVKLVNKLR